jgi:hypothetical protein
MIARNAVILLIECKKALRVGVKGGFILRLAANFRFGAAYEAKRDVNYLGHLDSIEITIGN